MNISWKMCAAVISVLAGSLLGQVSIEAPGGTSGGASGGASGGSSLPIAAPGSGTITAPTVATQPTSPPASMSSAESVLQQLLSNKQGSGGTAGSMGAGEMLIAPVGPPLGADGLLLEGQQLEMRSGHLKKDATGSMIFVFDEKETPRYPEMGVVPSRRLAAMEDAAGFGENPNGSDMNFRITAEVTQYRGKNFLYIKPSGIPVPPPAVPVKPAAAATQPVASTVAPNVPPAAPVAQGNVVTLRTGRLVKDAKTNGELIAFDSDGKLMADPPMGVIPCKYLQVMEDATNFGTKPLKFQVSGEVTTYRGKNYLYLKYVKVVLDRNGGIGAGNNPVLGASN